jgi:perosamine synthetase
MRIRRTLPPTAAPLTLGDLLHGLAGAVSGEQYLRRLETQLRADFAAKHVFLVSSGKAALTLILLALRRLSGRTEVLLPAYTCFSVPAAVERAGLSVKLADVDPETFDFDQESLVKSLGPETLCVIAHHLFGIPSDIERLRRLCGQTGAFLVEDAAQAMGGRYQGHSLGSLGDVGFFSLGRGKNITAGSGGIILTNSDRIAGALATEHDRLETPGATSALGELLRLVLMSLFIRPRLYWLPASMTFLRLGETRFDRDFPMRRMSGMNAGILSDWRIRLTQANRARAAAANYFAARVGLPHAQDSDIPYLRLPMLMPSRAVRDRLYALAVRRGLGVSRMYPTPVNEIEEIKDRFHGQTFPSAKLIADTLLVLPTHHLLTDTDRRSVCDLLEYGDLRGRPNHTATTDEIGNVAGRRWS